MIWMFRYGMTALWLALLVACATDKEDDEPSEPRGRVEIVGRVASIPPGRDFVLIQSFGEWRVPAGTILTTRGADERSASLLVTGERLGQFAAADIRAGEVVVGDAVLRLPEAPPPAPVPSPAEGSGVDAGDEPATDSGGGLGV